MAGASLAQDMRPLPLAPDAQERALTALLESPPDDGLEVRGHEREALKEAVRRFYAQRGHRPAWIGPEGPRVSAALLLTALESAADEGLSPATYQRHALAARTFSESPPSGEDRLALDVSLTRAALLFARHVALGRVPPSMMDRNWSFQQREVDFPGILAQLIQRGSVDRIAAHVAPTWPAYQRLRNLRQHYLAIHARGGWPTVRTRTLRQGQDAPTDVIRRLEQRLAVEGFLPPPTVGPADVETRPYDQRLVEAVVRFQRAHGLEADGVVGSATLDAMNVSALDRARQVALNMERWRWLPELPQDRHLLVNVAAFELQLLDGDSVTDRMAVVVGSRDGWRTPLFGAHLQRVILRPVWNVPQSIAQADILPKLQDDPDYLRRNGFQVVGSDGVVDPDELNWGDAEASAYQFRQLPGQRNAMGLFKFELDANNAIYLHDTPADALFANTVRDYSHGCIRVERPMDVAAFLLSEDPQWTRERLAEVIKSGERTTVEPPQRTPVHILYWTVDAGPDDGDVRFFPDIYGVDARLERALANT